MKNIMTTVLLVIGSLSVPAWALQSATSSGSMGSPGPQSSAAQQNSTDLRLGFSVQQELRKQVKNYNPGRQIVSAQNGEVTLSGSVNSRIQAEEMERSVRRVRGVSRVNNNLVVNVEAELTNTDAFELDSE